MATKVLVPIANGTEDIEAVTIIDVLRRACIEVTVASVEEITITASRGVKITADVCLADCADRDYDMIVLPGGMPGAENLRDCESLTQMLKAQAKADKYYAAICASPAIILQHHGLLSGKVATCYPTMSKDVTGFVDNEVVVDGKCITSQGPATAMPFALKLIEVLLGTEKATSVANGLLINQY